MSLAVIACLLAAAFTWLSIRVSLGLGLTADKIPTPNTGGVAILSACAAVYLLGARGEHSVIVAAAAGVAALGFVDDRIRLRPLFKFLGQCLAALTVIASGAIFHATGSKPLNFVITLLWITGITNAFNLIDNMDGLCAGVTVIIAGFRFVSALQSGDEPGARLVAIVGGAFLGFLFFNYKPARIFMGDTGSMFAGFLLGSLAIAAPVPQTQGFFSGVLYPMLTFVYPIFDALLVSFLRRMGGQPISVGGRDHSSHRLAALGLGECKVVWVLWALTGIGCAAGLVTFSLPAGVLAIAFFLGLAITIFGIFLASVPGYETH